jgi:hypothetical protein
MLDRGRLDHLQFSTRSTSKVGAILATAHRQLRTANDRRAAKIERLSQLVQLDQALGVLTRLVVGLHHHALPKTVLKPETDLLGGGRGDDLAQAHYTLASAPTRPSFLISCSISCGFVW